MFFFFKQKTAYEILDWSSDVCSSDLPTSITNSRVSVTADLFRCEVCGITAFGGLNEKYSSGLHAFLPWNESLSLSSLFRSEERRVGKECRSRWSAYL